MRKEVGRRIERGKRKEKRRRKRKGEKRCTCTVHVLQLLFTFQSCNDAR